MTDLNLNILNFQRCNGLSSLLASLARGTKALSVGQGSGACALLFRARIRGSALFYIRDTHDEMTAIREINARK